MITNQEAFDRSLAHLRVQQRKAYEDGACMYRINGLKCAIGALIPDENYDPDLEYLGASYKHVITAFNGNPIQADFYRDTQKYLHDDLNENLKGLEQKAQDLANEWSLIYVQA